MPNDLIALAERCEAQAVQMLKREIGAEHMSVDVATYCARLLQSAASLRARASQEVNHAE